MFFIPAMAIGAGISLTVWGVRTIINQDDSADEAVAKFISKIPKYIKEYIEELGIDEQGRLFVKFKRNTPREIEEDFQKNVTPLQYEKR